MKDLDKEIEDVDNQIEKLKILKQKKLEMKKLQQEISNLETDLKPQMRKQKTTKFKFRLPKKTASLVIATLLFLTVLFVYFPMTQAATPTIAYSSINNGENFVDVIPGEGVNMTVNASDSDNDIQSVIISSNSSGTWQTFYNSGPLGGVEFHNTSQIVNYNWTGSWVTYYFNVTVNDGSDYDFVYSFTTEYVFGNPHMEVVDDTNSITLSAILKNSTDDYYLFNNRNNLEVRTSENPTNFALKSDTYIATTQGGPYNAFKYNNNPHVYAFASDYLYVYYYDGSWHSTTTGIVQRNTVYRTETIYGADVKYFDGQWHLVAGTTPNEHLRLRAYTSSTPVSGFSYLAQFEDVAYSSGMTGYYYPTLCIYNSTLHLVYHDYNTYGYYSDDAEWWTYNGANWAYQGKLADDIDNTGGVSLTADRENNQMVISYISGDNKLYYKTYNGSSWSDSHLIFTPEAGFDIEHPCIHFIDGRITITFAYNLRGNWNLYSISAPDYLSISGVGRLNHIEFPDSAPNAQHVNSSVFATKNINPRNILNITWHFEDIGDVNISNNLIVWSNMTGTWTNSWAVDGVGNTSKIDISAVKGSEWQAGESLYWKIEILDVGPVPETLHTTDEDIYMLIDLEI